MKVSTHPTRSDLRALILSILGCSLAVSPIRAELVVQAIYRSVPSQSTVPFSGLVQGRDGNFYGTQPSDPVGGGGRVFRLTSAGAITTPVGFTGANGRDPEGGLVLAADGNLYGTTAGGGTYGLGTLFKLSASGAFQSLHSFRGTDGAAPMFNLVQGTDGFLYGVTLGTTSNLPTVFRATTTGQVTTLTNLPGPLPQTDYLPSDGLVQGPDGWLYGTTTSGSIISSHVIGSIYKVAINGTFLTLVTFRSNPTPFRGGERPIGGLAVGPDGCLYGTLGPGDPGPATDKGRVFRMTTNGTLTTLFSFTDTYGYNPMTRLVLAGDGAFYGLTASGGPNKRGSIFRITTEGLLSTLAEGFGMYGFNSGVPALFEASDGNLYGTALDPPVMVSSRLVYRLVTPPAITNATLSNGRLTLTWNSFTNGNYRLACCDSVTATNWTNLGTIVATGATATASDYIGGRAQRFYRVMLLP